MRIDFDCMGSHTKIDISVEDAHSGIISLDLDSDLLIEFCEDYLLVIDRENPCEEKPK